MTDPISMVTGMVTDTVDGVAGTVTDTVNGVAGTVTDTVNGVAGTVTDTVNGVAGTVTDTVDGVTDTVTGEPAMYTEPAAPDPFLGGAPMPGDSGAPPVPAEYAPASTAFPQSQPELSTTSAGEAGGDTGSGVYENYDGQVAALEQESAAEGEQLAGGAGAGGGGDPLTMLVSAGVGWLLGHVSFITEPLDALAGDPAAIQAQVDQLMQNATEMMTIANEHGEHVAAANDWTGAAAEAFHGSMDRLGGELASMSSAMGGTASITAVAGEMVLAVRDAVEALINDLVTQLVVGALTAMAWSVITFGASVVTYIAVAIAAAVAVTVVNIAKIQELMAALQRQGERVAQLGTMMEEIATSIGRFDKAAGTA